VNLVVEEFMVPLTTIVQSQFITARAAARRMVKERSGVIVFVTGSPARGHVEGATAIGAAFGAIETFMENLALEVGSARVRAVCVRTTANVDSRSIKQTMDFMAGASDVSKEQMIARIASFNFLKIPASVSDTAKAAAFLASDRARMMTGTVMNTTAGAAAD
jgi:NAD(P)-dependent dehydrogenase (short-subunit alcohol dehydrogenase family)